MTNLHKPFISIGIPFYNAEATLLDAIRSVFAQTHQNWELILVDDGSTDRSLELAKSINDPRVKVYSDGTNRRLATRLNQIIKLSKYDFVARMDADDLMSPTRLEKQLELLLLKPDIDLISTGLCSVTNEYEPVSTRCVSSNHTIEPDKLIQGNSGIVHASLLGRRSWFERNPYKESMLVGQDTNLWVRAYSNNDLKVNFISEPLYYYFEDNNVTPKKLLRAYKMQCHTITKDAKQGFSTKLKLKTLSGYVVKTFFVKFFTKTALKMARKRRITAELSDFDKKNMMNEIRCIRSTPIPTTEVEA